MFCARVLYLALKGSRYSSCAMHAAEIADMYRNRRLISSSYEEPHNTQKRERHQESPAVEEQGTTAGDNRYCRNPSLTIDPFSAPNATTRKDGDSLPAHTTKGNCRQRRNCSPSSILNDAYASEHAPQTSLLHFHTSLPWTDCPRHVSLHINQQHSNSSHKRSQLTVATSPNILQPGSSLPFLLLDDLS